jgi:hypothetical protein
MDMKASELWEVAKNFLVKYVHSVGVHLFTLLDDGFAIWIWGWVEGRLLDGWGEEYRFSVLG